MWWGTQVPPFQAFLSPCLPGGPKGVKFRAHFMRPFAPCFEGSAASPHLYLLTQLLIDMTSDETSRRETGSTPSDQIGKVFIVVGQDVRQCLICNGMFTRRASAEHAKVGCHWVMSANH
jgi:hypothetical protein